MILLLAAIAGGLGAAARFLLDRAISARSRRAPVPLGVIAVNVSACLALGLLTGWAGGRPDAGPYLAVIGTGFLGGYSTFSTAMAEGARLVIERRYLAAAIHSGGMLLLSLAASALGLWLGAALA